MCICCAHVANQIFLKPWRNTLLFGSMTATNLAVGTQSDIWLIAHAIPQNVRVNWNLFLSFSASKQSSEASLIQICRVIVLSLLMSRLLPLCKLMRFWGRPKQVVRQKKNSEVTTGLHQEHLLEKVLWIYNQLILRRPGIFVFSLEFVTTHLLRFAHVFFLTMQMSRCCQFLLFISYSSHL